MKIFRTLFNVTILASTVAISLSSQATEEVKSQQITEPLITKNIKIINLQMTTQIKQDIQKSLKTMLMLKVNDGDALLTKSTNENIALSVSEEVE